MLPGWVLALALLIGVVAGLRAALAPAVVAWAAHLGWINLHGSPLAFMGSALAVALFTLFAVGELIGDQRPGAMRRTESLPLLARLVLGGLAGGALAIVGGQPILLGAGLGAIGGAVGAFAGYEGRRRAVRAFKVSDHLIAGLEDAIALGGGLLIVARF